MNLKLPAVIIVFLTCFRTVARDEAPTNALPVIADCQYADDQAAEAAWKPSEKTTGPALAGMVDGRKVLRLPCKFTEAKGTRWAWDHKVQLDLTSARGIQFDFLCRKTLPVSYFNFYLQSGKGWYHAIFFPESATNWNTIVLDKTGMNTEGKPEGWNHITGIRISANRSGVESTELFVSDIRQTAPVPQPGTREAAQQAISDISKLASFRSFEQATNEILRDGQGNPRVADEMSLVTSNRDSAIQFFGEKEFPSAIVHASVAHEELKTAYCLAQKPEANEFRAFWCHKALGVAGLSWDEAIHRLAENGFTAIMPNMLAGGVAWYDSKVLPVSPDVAKHGDQIAECLAACKKYGIKMYVWKLNWNLGAAPKDFVEKMRAAGRLQKSSKGVEELWLCPSQPDNQKLELDAMLEVVRNYDVDGIQFDYIRYPDVDHCFCDGCRERFQKTTGATLKNWPEDVLEGGPLRESWLDWRRSNITKLVKAVSEQARALKPKIQLCADVFRYWTTDRDAVGQDWKIWCDRGYLDFVCPMDYTPSVARFQDMVSQQVQWAGKARCYPGLGASASTSHFGEDRAIEEIKVTRQFKTGGFVIFNYGANEARELLPRLGLGITRPDK
jgi:uncharacterized lipoprotein YddW (UPF0748 family)